MVEDDILFTNHPRASMCNSYTFSIFILYLPSADEVWGKIIFSEVSVILSTRGGAGGFFPACITGYMSRDICLQGVCIQGNLHPGKSASKSEGVWIRGCWANLLRYIGYGQQAGATHPAGMHFCYIRNKQIMRSVVQKSMNLECVLKL